MRSRLSDLDRDLARVETLIGDITGTRPIGFRAPYLLGPRFYRREVYDLLADHGYRWVSNREIRYPVELLRPDRLPLPRGCRQIPAAAAARVARSRLMLAGLNAGLVARETFAGSAPGRLRWLLGRPPAVPAGPPGGNPVVRAARLRPARPARARAGHCAVPARLRQVGVARCGGPARGGRDDHLPRLDCRRRQPPCPARRCPEGRGADGPGGGDDRGKRRLAGGVAAGPARPG